MRSETQIDDLISKCDEHEMAGSSNYPGMTYEQGVAAALRWALGESDDNPMAD